MNFNSEWRTIKNHRIFLSCRDGFPIERYWDKAKQIIDEIPCPNARLVEIFVDERNGINTFKVVTDDKKRFEPLKDALKNGYLREDGNTVVEVLYVEPCLNKNSDRYDHMKYLATCIGLIKPD